MCIKVYRGITLIGANAVQIKVLLGAIKTLGHAFLKQIQKFSTHCAEKYFPQIKYVTQGLLSNTFRCTRSCSFKSFWRKGGGGQGFMNTTT